ncbi:MAG: hypothetical protein ABR955_13790 [Verrucomicrobiota bacterium]
MSACESNPVADVRPSDSAFVLFDCCGDFYRQYRHWPKDFVELSSFDQQSKGMLKSGHYDQVAFTSLKDGDLGIFVVSDGVTNSGVLSPAPAKNKQ